MDQTPTQVELALRHGKEMLSAVSLVASQVERGGGVVDVEKALHNIAEVVPTLESLGAGHLSTAVGGMVIDHGCPSFARTTGVSSGTVRATEMQKRRAQQVLADLQLVEITLHRFQRQQRQQNQQSNVQQLMGSYSADAARTEYAALDHLSEEEKSLKYARRRMQQMQYESAAVLSALQGQGRRLGGMGDKMADMMESLGVSNTTILQIVRRNQMDAWLVYAGIISLLLLLWYLW